MKANENYILNILNGNDKTFHIPVYQRPYNWKIDNCKMLLEDLINISIKGNKSHFFGSIVYVAKEIAGAWEYTIIDGQQRLTTISLLLLAIRNLMLNKNFESKIIKPDKIIKAYLIDEFANDEVKLKLKLIEGDDKVYENIIYNQTIEIKNTLSVNYNYFYNFLSEKPLEEVEYIYNSILKLSVVNISLEVDKGDDPQLIFESLNSTGLNLDESDKIRNFVLMNLDSGKQKLIYKNYWCKIEEKINKNELSDFLKYYISYKTNQVFGKNNLYFKFKDYIKQKNTDIEEILKDIIVFAKYYNTFCYSDLKDIKCLLSLRKLEVYSVIPTIFDILDALNNNQINEEEFNKIILLLESYIVRRNICSLPSNMMSTMFVNLPYEIKNAIKKFNVKYYDAFEHILYSKKQKTRFPRNEEVKEKFKNFELYNTKSLFRKFYLEKLENYNNKEFMDVYDLLERKILSIDHIMPQTLSNDWKRILGDNYPIIHNKYLHVPGNITLTAYNSEYSNLTFIEKRDLKNIGFKDSKLNLNKNLCNYENWSDKEIKKRTQNMCNITIDIWPIPDSRIDENIDYWISLDEDYDFTNKKIKSVKLMGEIYDTKSVTEVFTKVNELLFYLDEMSFRKSDIPILSDNKSKLRKPFKLANDVYLEKNLSSNDKINYLKKIFKLSSLSLNELELLIEDN